MPRRPYGLRIRIHRHARDRGAPPRSRWPETGAGPQSSAQGVYQLAFDVGGEYDEGALRIGGLTVGDYSTAAGSFGFQAGADAWVSLIKVGANGTIDSSTVSSAVIAFALINDGLFGGVNLNGSKISEMDH